MNLNQITIPSENVEKATAFYKILGLHLIVDSIPEYVRFVCPNGDSTLSIHKVDELPNGNEITLYFENDNLDETVWNLKQKGIAFSSEPEDKPWLWREARLNDLDGNKIIIYYAGKNRKNPPWHI
ncbi:MAG: catechol 2,3-dioxygenase-like lactoylglutathione lyase family enzyme [Mariniflexile sp.]|jgi:catechol 2,3-dioxygenase-like lactoylglutathione lyase family enzyme